jgi:serine/threonine protein kinase
MTEDSVNTTRTMTGDSFLRGSVPGDDIWRCSSTVNPTRTMAGDSVLSRSAYWSSMGSERHTIDEKIRMRASRVSAKESEEEGDEAVGDSEKNRDEAVGDSEKNMQWPGPTSVDYADICAALSKRVQSGLHELFVFDSSMLLGRGASCNVYRAELYGVMCAIKVLNTSFMEKGCKAEHQFIAEIDILTSCRHTNICSLYASSTNGDHKCAVLELMDMSLEKRLQDPAFPLLSWQQRVYIALCMFRGVLALHSMRPVQIHRDIKTSNLLLSGFKTSTIYPSCIAKISDFGTARAFDHGVSVSTPLQQLKSRMRT